MNIQVHINVNKIPINDRAFNFGDGLFETILVENNEAKFLNEHISRLFLGCNKLKIKKPDKAIICKSISKAIGVSKKCIIKLIYSRGISEHGYKYDQKIIPQLYIYKKRYIQSSKQSNLQLDLCKYKIQENTLLSKIKHINRLDQIVASSENIKNKYDELVLASNTNNIVECISSNIFFYNFNKNIFTVYTPDLTKYGVEGVMRNKVIKRLKRKKIRILIKDIPVKDYSKFTGCFITNCIQGVRLVKNFNKKVYSDIPMIRTILDNYIYEK